MDKAIVSSVVKLPRSLVDEAAVEEALSIKVWDQVEQTSHTIKAYSKDRTYYTVPRQFGLDIASRYGIDVVWWTSTGFEQSEFNAIELFDYQNPWVDSIVSKFLDEEDPDVYAIAATGKGKTVMSLEIMRRLGRTTLIVVDQEFLKDQWIQAAVKFLGVKKEDIGSIQGKTCDYEGRDIVIAMVQTIYNREYPQELYEYFGTVIFDEAHTIGAEQFSKVMTKFPADYRLAVTATDRTDALQKLLRLNLGDIKVTLKDKHTKSKVRYVEYDGVLSWYANVSPKTGRYLAELIGDARRNLLLARMIVSLHTTGRTVLAVSDRIEQLEDIKTLCYYLGVKEEDMGVIAGYHRVWKYAKDPTPPRKPYGLHKGAEYTPVKLQYVSKRVPKKTLDTIKETASILFATYGMFSKGVDVPRLSAGVDCTPRAKAQQVHGRILRPGSGKLVPIWATVRDFMSYKAEFQFSKRIDEYVKSNAEIEQWHVTKGTRKIDVRTLKEKVNKNIRRLKEAKILTNIEGNNIVVMQNTGRK